MQKNINHPLVNEILRELAGGGVKVVASEGYMVILMLARFWRQY